MMQYIFQLTKTDIKNVKAVANMQPGLGMSIDRKDGGLIISISEDQFKRMVYSLCRQAWNLPQVDVDAIDISSNVR